MAGAVHARTEQQLRYKAEWDRHLALRQSLREAGIPTMVIYRALRALNRQGRDTVRMTREQLAALSDAELLEMPNIGKKSLKQWRAVFPTPAGEGG